MVPSDLSCDPVYSISFKSSSFFYYLITMSPLIVPFDIRARPEAAPSAYGEPSCSVGTWRTPERKN